MDCMSAREWMSEDKLKRISLNKYFKRIYDVIDSRNHRFVISHSLLLVLLPLIFCYTAECLRDMFILFFIRKTRAICIQESNGLFYDKAKEQLWLLNNFECKTCKLIDLEQFHCCINFRSLRLFFKYFSKNFSFRSRLSILLLWILFASVWDFFCTNHNFNKFFFIIQGLTSK